MKPGKKPTRGPSAQDATSADPEEAFWHALEQLAMQCVATDRARMFDVGVVLVAVASHPSEANRRLLMHMASARRLPVGTTREERVTRAALLVEEYAPRLRTTASMDTLKVLARRIAAETGERALLGNLPNEAACAFMLATFATWVPTKPRTGEKSTAGVMAALAHRFRPAPATGLWGVTGQDEDRLRRSIESRLRAGRRAP